MEPKIDELRDGDDSQAMLLGKTLELRPAGHGSIIVHDLADHGGGLQISQAGKIHRTFGLSCPNQDSSLHGAERKNMARPYQILRSGARCHGRKNRVGTALGGLAWQQPIRRINTHRKGRIVLAGIFSDHHGEIELAEPGVGHGKTDQAAGLRGHEVDGLWSDELRCHAEISFVFPIFVIHKDQDFASLNLFYRFANVLEGHKFASWLVPVESRWGGFASAQ